MTTATLTLTDFLLARIAEDEAGFEDDFRFRVIKAEGIDPGGEYWWECFVCGAISEAHQFSGDLRASWRAHAAANACARELAECEAKRRIVEEHHVTRREPGYEYLDGYLDPCITCGQIRPRKYPCATLRALAAVYADHPDYRDEWRP